MAVGRLRAATATTMVFVRSIEVAEAHMVTIGATVIKISVVTDIQAITITFVTVADKGMIADMATPIAATERASVGLQEPGDTSRPGSLLL